MNNIYNVVDSYGKVCRRGYDWESACEVAAELQQECHEHFRVIKEVSDE